MKVYELEGIVAQLEEMGIDDESFQDTLESIDFQENLVANIENLIKWKRNAESNAEATKLEKQRLEKSEKAFKTEADKAGELLKRCYELGGRAKLQAGIFKVSHRKNKRVEITDETTIPLDYMIKTETYKPNKKAIKDAIESGVEIAGATLVEDYSVMVK